MFVPYYLSIKILLHYIFTILVVYKKININISKLSITFPQSGSYYVYVNGCVKFIVNVVNDDVSLYDLNYFKK